MSGKGSNRRPGAIPDGAWEAIFAPKAPCETCHGTGALNHHVALDEIHILDEYPCLECGGKGEVPCAN